jgi:hypothetical protein
MIMTMYDRLIPGPFDTFWHPLWTESVGQRTLVKQCIDIEVCAVVTFIVFLLVRNDPLGKIIKKSITSQTSKSAIQAFSHVSWSGKSCCL